MKKRNVTTNRSNIIKNTINNNFKKFGTFDPFLLAKNLKVRIEYCQFNGNPLGKAFCHDIFPTIMLDYSIKNDPQEFFICAHELCHILNHSHAKSLYKLNQFAKANMEIEANYFASELVIEDFKQSYNKYPDNFEEIQKNYGVPNNLIENFF